MPVNPEPILKTERLILRHPQAQDASAIFFAVSSPEFPEKLPLKEMESFSQIETWLNRLIEHWEEDRIYSWIMEDRDSGLLLGQMTLFKMEEDHKWALAFWTHPAHWGKGYATEGAERVVKFAFEVLGAKTIWAAAGKWNLGSNRVLEKVGMTYLGDNPQGYYSRGGAIPTHEYEISRGDWENIDRAE